MKIKNKSILFCAIILILIIVLIRSFYWMIYKASDKKGYYDNLVQQQHSLNTEDRENQREYSLAIAEGREPYLKYYFEITNIHYYVLKDIVFSIEGEKIIDLKQKSEGYFTHQNNLYSLFSFVKRHKDC